MGRWAVVRVAAVRFGPVQHDFLLNLKPDRWSGSANSLNLGPDLPEPVERVQSDTGLTVEPSWEG